MRYAIEAAVQLAGGEQRQYLVAKLLDELAVAFAQCKRPMRCELDRRQRPGTDGSVSLATGCRLENFRLARANLLGALKRSQP